MLPNSQAGAKVSKPCSLHYANAIREPAEIIESRNQRTNLLTITQLDLPPYTHTHTQTCCPKQQRHNMRRCHCHVERGEKVQYFMLLVWEVYIPALGAYFPQLFSVYSDEICFNTRVKIKLFWLSCPAKKSFWQYPEAIRYCVLIKASTSRCPKQTLSANCPELTRTLTPQRGQWWEYHIIQFQMVLTTIRKMTAIIWTHTHTHTHTQEQTWKRHLLRKCRSETSPWVWAVQPQARKVERQILHNKMWILIRDKLVYIDPFYFICGPASTCVKKHTNTHTMVNQRPWGERELYMQHTLYIWNKHIEKQCRTRQIPLL